MTTQLDFEWDAEPAPTVPTSPYDRIRYGVEERERTRHKKEAGQHDPAQAGEALALMTDDDAP